MKIGPRGVLGGVRPLYLPWTPSLAVLPFPRRAGVTEPKKILNQTRSQGSHPRGCNAPWKCRGVVRCVGPPQWRWSCSAILSTLCQKWGVALLCRFRTKSRPLSLLPLVPKASRPFDGTPSPPRPPPSLLPSPIHNNGSGASVGGLPLLWRTLKQHFGSGASVGGLPLLWRTPKQRRHVRSRVIAILAARFHNRYELAHVAERIRKDANFVVPVKGALPPQNEKAKRYDEKASKAEA